MIIMLSVSAIYLAGLQAGINAPRDAFTHCLKEATAKAESTKVPADGIEAFLRSSCSGQIDGFKAASISFDVKNGISKKEATSGADDMIGGWLESSIENYKFRASESAPKPQEPPATPPVQPAAQTQAQ